GFFLNDMTHRLGIIQIIGKYNPDLWFCNLIHDRHIDHAKRSQSVSGACFLLRLMQIEINSYRNKQMHWRPNHLYHYILWKNLDPDYVMDSSGYMDEKMKAELAYKTQFYNPQSKLPETPIASKNFTDSVDYRPRDLGRIIGVEHGEGYTVERYVGVNSVFDII